MGGRAGILCARGRRGHDSAEGHCRVMKPLRAKSLGKRGKSERLRTSYSGRGAWRNSDLQVRLRWRRLVLREELVSPERFCQRKGLSRAQLQELERRGQVFSVRIGRKRYFPAALADGSLTQRRLQRLAKSLPSTMPSIAKYLFLVGRKGSLGDKSPVQSLRRGKRFRVALRLADNEADEVLRAKALRRGTIRSSLPFRPKIILAL